MDLIRFRLISIIRRGNARRRNTCKLIERHEINATPVELRVHTSLVRDSVRYELDTLRQ